MAAKSMGGNVTWKLRYTHVVQGVGLKRVHAEGWGFDLSMV